MRMQCARRATEAAGDGPVRCAAACRRTKAGRLKTFASRACQPPPLPRRSLLSAYPLCRRAVAAHLLDSFLTSGPFNEDEVRGLEPSWLKLRKARRWCL
jgi:hypothetical protein